MLANKDFKPDIWSDDSRAAILFEAIFRKSLFTNLLNMEFIFESRSLVLLICVIFPAIFCKVLSTLATNSSYVYHNPRRTLEIDASVSKRPEMGFLWNYVVPPIKAWTGDQFRRNLAWKWSCLLSSVFTKAIFISMATPKRGVPWGHFSNNNDRIGTCRWYICPFEITTRW